MFNLFRLHDWKEDLTPRSWIKVGGKKLLNEMRKIVIEILNNKNISIRELAKIIASKLNTKWEFIASYLREIKNNRWKERRPFIPIPLIESLLETKSPEGGEEKWNVIHLAEWFVCGVPLSKPIRLPKKLTKGLAKICGAHVADGTLVKSKTKHGFSYTWRITHGDRIALEYLRSWIKDSFGIDAKIKKSNHGNFYIISINRKVVFRFLTRIIGFPIGDKSSIISMPEIIRNSNQEMKRNFALGVLNFDGCVNIDGCVWLTSKSKRLRDKVAEIMKNDGLEVFTSTKSDKNGRWYLRSKALENRSLLLNYFIKRSKPWLRAKGFIDNFKNEDILSIFKKTSTSKTSLKEVLNLVIKLKTFDKIVLSRKLGVNEKTSRTYLKILEKAGIIKKIKSNSRISFPVILDNFDDTTRLKLNSRFRKRLFQKLLDKYKTLTKLAEVMKTNIKNVSRWKLSQRKLTINNFKKLLALVGLKEKEASNGIEGFGKNIYVLTDYLNQSYS